MSFAIRTREGTKFFPGSRAEAAQKLYDPKTAFGNTELIQVSTVPEDEEGREIVEGSLTEKGYLLTWECPGCSHHNELDTDEYPDEVQECETCDKQFTIQF